MAAFANEINDGPMIFAALDSFQLTVDFCSEAALNRAFRS
jgi:hypothetical protein